MSIPDRFYRIAKHKLGEMKDWFDKVDEEEFADTQRRRDPRADARRELIESLAPSSGTTSSGANPGGLQPASSPNNSPNGVPMNPPRTASSGFTGGTGRPPLPPSSVATGQGSTPDPLDYHYRLLSLEPGADFGSVQAAYNRLSARCDPSRFPAGSAEERQAQQIRERLDTSYKQLRDVLDTTATRFDRLEF